VRFLWYCFTPSRGAVRWVDASRGSRARLDEENNRRMTPVVIRKGERWL
jgi:hypothetical protein